MRTKVFAGLFVGLLLTGILLASFLAFIKFLVATSDVKPPFYIELLFIMNLSFNLGMAIFSIIKVTEWAVGDKKDEKN